MSDSKDFILGVYDDEDVLLSAVGKIRGAGIKIDEVYSPFPVHGLDDELGYKKSRLPIAAFMFGILGTTLALTMQIWMLGIDWPMIIGGKNHVALPDFVPVTFELTVLLAAFGMVGTFLVSSDLKPWKDPKLLDIRITDDKHIMAIDLGQNKAVDAEKIGSALKDSGAVEVNDKKVEE
ncbi:DUF3341 domain-containing protein [Roseivirga sp. E12]|uniref:DUF3341 domain-containing protein n=1 Tax=Roseivirga sp. E12 TaxID=2819237 RepID=UPI001ABC2BBA|nr:DUF3341 domain-containing protein [Roseivirga sp. E12]MBO3698479.1 DUF3341 domain-containing protein [Roseivirga sp. E12]